MEIGFVGLGKMGMNMVERLRRDNHQIVAFDLDDAKRKEVSTFGADGVNSLKDLVARLAPPRGVWVMVPAGEPTDSTITATGGTARARRRDHRRRQHQLPRRRAPRRGARRQEGLHLSMPAPAAASGASRSATA